MELRVLCYAAAIQLPLLLLTQIKENKKFITPMATIYRLEAQLLPLMGPQNEEQPMQTIRYIMVMTS